MRLEDLQKYFARKLAKAITYNISVGDGRRDHYEIEPIAVREGSLFATVSYKYSVTPTARIGSRRFCGEVEVPMTEGDKIESLLLMAVIATDYDGVSLEPGSRAAEARAEFLGRASFRGLTM